MEKRSLLQNQHPFTKLIISLLLIVFALIASPLPFCCLFFLFLIYLLALPKIIIHWLQLLLRLLPLFITILIFGIIANDNFYDVLLLLARLVLMLMLSAYLFKSSDISQLATILPAHKDLQTYLQATLLFVPLFFDNFDQARSQTGNLAEIVNLSLKNTHKHIDDIRLKVDNITQKETGFDLLADLYGVLLLILAVLIFLFIR